MATCASQFCAANESTVQATLPSGRVTRNTAQPDAQRPSSLGVGVKSAAPPSGHAGDPHGPLFYLGAMALGCAVKSGTSLLNRMSRLRASDTDRIADSPAVWFASYFALFVFQLVAVLRESSAQRKGGGTGVRLVLTPVEGSLLLLVALVYTLMENLQFYVLEEVQAPVFQTFGNLKVLAAALFSRLILGTRFKAHQYFAMALLITGSCLLRFSIMWVSSSRIVATIVLILCSGFNLVLYEKLVCKPNLSVALCNATFYFSSMLLHGALAASTETGLLGNLLSFNLVTWGAVGGHVLNGTANTILVVYAGAVGKQFISQGAVVALALIGLASKSDTFHLSPGFALASVFVFGGVWSWKYPPAFLESMSLASKLPKGSAGKKAHAE